MALSAGESVTVIVTTSPTPRSDPEPHMLERTMRSLSLAGLSSCRTILVMDWFDAGEPRKKCMCGRLPADRIAAYRARTDSVVGSARGGLLGGGRGLLELEVLRLRTWHGFALAVKRALEEVGTPLVCVVQHDLVFRRPIDVVPVLDVLCEANNGVNYVCFKRDAQRNYGSKVKSLHKLELGPPKLFGTVPLLRLPRYFDGTHIAATDWYTRFLSDTETNFKPGHFIDQILGKRMLDAAIEHPECDCDDDDNTTRTEGAAKISRGVLDICKEYGCWMWTGEEEPLIEHLNGRKLLGTAELLKRRTPKTKK